MTVSIKNMSQTFTFVPKEATTWPPYHHSHPPLLYKILLGKNPLPNKRSGYDTKQSNNEAPVMLELWEMRSTPSLPSLSGPLLLVVGAPESVLSIGQIELFDT